MASIDVCSTTNFGFLWLVFLVILSMSYLFHRWTSTLCLPIHLYLFTYFVFYFQFHFVDFLLVNALLHIIFIYLLNLFFSVNHLFLSWSSSSFKIQRNSSAVVTYNQYALQWMMNTILYVFVFVCMYELCVDILISHKSNTSELLNHIIELIKTECCSPVVYEYVICILRFSTFCFGRYFISFFFFSLFRCCYFSFFVLTAQKNTFS